MFKLLKLTLKYGKKAVLFTEIAMESLHLKHKSAHNLHKHEAKHLNYTTSENVFNNIKSQVVNLHQSDKGFIGSGVVFNNNILLYSDIFNREDNRVNVKRINDDNLGNKANAQLVYRKPDDNISLYKMEYSLNNFQDTHRAANLSKGEQILVYSPLAEGEYTLLDSYVTKVNQMEEGCDYLYHRTSLVNNDSRFPDIVYDYEGNFQGIIPADSDCLICARYLFGILNRYSKYGELKHTQLPFVFKDDYSNESGALTISEVIPQYKYLEKYKGWTIKEVWNIPVVSQKELIKIIGYSSNTAVELMVKNQNGDQELLKIKLN